MNIKCKFHLHDWKYSDSYPNSIRTCKRCGLEQHYTSFVPEYSSDANWAKKWQ